MNPQEEKEWEKEFNKEFAEYFRVKDEIHRTTTNTYVQLQIITFIRSIEDRTRLSHGLTCSKIALEEIAEAEKRGYEKGQNDAWEKYNKDDEEWEKEKLTHKP